jgi:hypothetical protein
MVSKMAFVEPSRTRRWRAFRLRAVIFSLMMGSAFLLSASAHAGKNDEKDVKAKARTLASEGIEALKGGQFGVAESKLAEAEALFHAPPHLLYLARAQAGLGKLRDAKATLEKLAADSLPAGAPPAFIQAKDEGAKDLIAIAERIPTIQYSVEPKTEGTKISLDGAPLSALSGTVEVDVGSHTLEATPPSGKSQSKTVDAKERDRLDVKLVLSTGASTPVEGPDEDKSDGPSGLMIGGIITMSVGAIGLGTGGAMLGLYAGKRSDGDAAYDACAKKYAPAPCQGADADAVQAIDDEGNLFGTLSIVALAGGAAIAGVGIALTVVGASEGDEAAPATAVTLSPVVAPGFVGVRGAF